MGSYFVLPAGGNNNTLPNRNLDLIKSHHIVMAYDHTFKGKMRLHTEAYFQYLFDLPRAFVNQEHIAF
jgi:hypothetical protein